MDVETRVVLAADHAGFALKAHLAAWLLASGHAVEDLGTFSTEPVDYPALCAAAARFVVAGRADVGVVIGGSGQGEALAANKVRGARAALCNDERLARLARAHNDANVLALGARIVADELARDILATFLATPFEGGRHVARLAAVRAIEDEEAARSSKRSPQR